MEGPAQAARRWRRGFVWTNRGTHAHAQGTTTPWNNGIHGTSSTTRSHQRANHNNQGYREARAGMDRPPSASSASSIRQGFPSRIVNTCHPHTAEARGKRTKPTCPRGVEVVIIVVPIAIAEAARQGPKGQPRIRKGARARVTRLRPLNMLCRQQQRNAHTLPSIDRTQGADPEPIQVVPKVLVVLRSIVLHRPFLSVSCCFCPGVPCVALRGRTSFTTYRTRTDAWCAETRAVKRRNCIARGTNI